MTNSYNKKIISIFIFFFIVNIIYFLLSRKYQLFENGVYIRYFESMFKDQDFNIFNQFSSSYDRWMATITHNHPDYHSPFISSLLVLPYLFNCTFTLFLPSDLGNPMIASHLFFTLCLFAVVILEGYNEEHPKLNSYKSWLYMLVFSTGTLWFTLFDPTEISGICLIFSLIIFFELYKFWKNNSENILTLSLAIGFFSILKPDGLFYAFALCTILIFQKNWKKIVPILTSLIFFQSQILIINFIRYGAFLPANPVVTFDHTFLLEFLIGPNGLLTKTPVHILLIIIMLYRSFTSTIPRERYLMVFALLVTLTKAIMVSFAVTPVTDYVANRHSIAELPFFAYALFSLFNDKRLTGRILLGIFILWNIYDVYGIFLQEENAIFHYMTSRMVPFEKAGEYFHKVKEAINYSLTNFNKDQGQILFLSFQSSVFLTLSCLLHLKYHSVFRNVFLGILVFMTVTFTFTDLINNQKNSNRMYANLMFNNTVIVKGSALYYDEAISMVEHMKRVNLYYGKPEMSYIEKFQKSYIDGIYENIINDPTQFTMNLKLNYIRPSFWELKSKASASEKTYP